MWDKVKGEGQGPKICHWSTSKLWFYNGSQLTPDGYLMTKMFQILFNKIFLRAQ